MAGPRLAPAMGRQQADQRLHVRQHTGIRSRHPSRTYRSRPVTTPFHDDLMTVARNGRGAVAARQAGAAAPSLATAVVTSESTDWTGRHAPDCGRSAAATPVQQAARPGMRKHECFTRCYPGDRFQPTDGTRSRKLAFGCPLLPDRRPEQASRRKISRTGR